MATEILADDAALRLARRRRAFAAMDAAGLDVLLLGREANARYVSGAPRLWTAGTRPFGPGCVVVRQGEAIHLVSTWDEGIPDDIPHDRLFGITWNPGKLLAWLGGIEGTAGARRIGTDSLTPRFARLLPKVFPGAELVDAEPALEAARRVKTPEEIEAIRASLRVAETALAATVDALRPGVTERRLAARFMEAMARQGVTTPSTQQVAWVATGPLPRRRDEHGPIGPSELVSFDAGVVAGGYTGEVGRTWPADPDAADGGAKDLQRRADDLSDRLVGACRPGAACSGLLAAYEAEGQAPPPFPIATGLGLGFDLPVVTRELPRTAEHEVLEPGMVLAVTAVVDDGSRSALRKEAVLVTDDGPTLLSGAPRWIP
jgi:Xaa-Pro aminopeptidase